MANNENLKPVRTKSEARERGRNGGKKSGEARRRKADFRRTLNMLLTAKIDSSEWTPFLESLGLDSTLESAVNAAMIREALSGNVKAYEAIAKYSGQSPEPDENRRNREADTELKQARKKAVTGENESAEAVEKLDQILKGIYENAVKQQAE